MVRRREVVQVVAWSRVDVRTRVGVGGLQLRGVGITIGEGVEEL